MPFDFSSASYIPPQDGALGWVFVCFLASLGLGAGSAIVLMFVRARQLASAQAREHAWLHEHAIKPLFPGPSRVVSGRVELDGGETVAVEVDIVQEVKNHTSKNSRWHTWNEVTRTVRALPFYLVREDGQPVYVEPNQGALIVDSLATSYPVEMPHRRVRAADVRVGEQFFAYGDLVEAQHPRAGGGYRDRVGWVLRPPQRGRMLLATEGIRDRYKDRVSYLWKAGLALVVVFGLVHTIFTLPCVVASLWGTSTTTTVEGTNTYVTHGKHTTTRHYELITRTADGYARKDDVPVVVYDAARSALKRGETVTAPLIRTPGWDAANFLGNELYASTPGLIIILIFATVIFLLVRAAYLSRYSWYDKQKLVERGGNGHWVEPRPQNPVPPGTN